MQNKYKNKKHMRRKGHLTPFLPWYALYRFSFTAVKRPLLRPSDKLNLRLPRLTVAENGKRNGVPH